jgi:hypothetical protein
MADTKAHQRYRTKAGAIVPGVTTILNLLNKPFLVPWAWRLGMQGEDYRKVTQQAADIGTIAHYLIECHIKGEPADPNRLAEFSQVNLAAAQVAYHKFEAWWEEQGLCLFKCRDMDDELVPTSEVRLVSDTLLYGGCIDILAVNKRKERLLLDIKTSKAVYDEYRYQLAAYMHLWEENNPKLPLDGAYIIHVSKETGDIGFIFLGRVLETEWQIFDHLRAIYRLQRPADKHRNADRKFRFKRPVDA